MRGRRIFISVALLLGGLAGGLVAAEGLVRLVAPMPVKADSGQFYQPHPLYGWTHIPNQRGPWAGIGSLPKEFKTEVRINSRGLRDREISYEKPNGVRRILLLGDSMTEGLQVQLEETFAKRLEAILTASGKRVEVINSGTGGYGTGLELLFYRHEGKRYRPDLVLLAFFVNDLLDNFPPVAAADGRRGKPYFVLTPSGPVLENFPLPVTPTVAETAGRSGWLDQIKVFLAEHSELYSLGTTVLLRYPRTMRALNRLGLARAGTVAHADAAARTRTDDPVYYLPFRVPEDPRLAPAWALTEALLLALRREVEAEGSRFGVVILTAPEQVHPDLWRLAQQRFPALLKDQFDLEQPNRILRAFLEEEKMAYVDLAPPLRARAAAGGEHLHFPYDGHYTAAGHAAAAEGIATFLHSSGLLSRLGPGAETRGPDPDTVRCIRELTSPWTFGSRNYDQHLVEELLASQAFMGAILLDAGCERKS